MSRPTSGSHDETQVVAVMKPHSGATLIHLYLADYQPGRKQRSAHYPVSMCGAEPVTTELVLGGRTRTTGRVQMPLAEASELVSPTSYHRWCPPCIGRLADLDGSTIAVIEHHLKEKR